ncbi:MAG: hypothetical protein ACJASR_001853 [Psychroserpens sp.]|jgi:hypothetical protein
MKNDETNIKRQESSDTIDKNLMRIKSIEKPQDIYERLQNSILKPPPIMKKETIKKRP